MLLSYDPNLCSDGVTGELFDAGRPGEDEFELKVVVPVGGTPPLAGFCCTCDDPFDRLHEKNSLITILV